ncbi:hypothetical protein Q7C36_013094 [Tachysurus vachellii]|uniref:UBZ2-type domain-containing protein n=1 Tax=Tachysurus vachellii TaxID=175792 RepID=A0AA88SL08_TACVA|nr:uncharacterized protein si:ch73-70k4.1 [Tachysurus vachellii]KAK2841515.1 hypothetical protein Q7C36_013094 [Tachysurus vachellii]
MSKLKRRKTAVEEIRSEHQFRIKDLNQSLRIPDAGSPAGEGSSYWTSPDLSDVEKVWLEILQSLCPQFLAQDTTLCVPHLPQLSVKEEKQSEHHWCSLDEEVLPFPNALALSIPFLYSPVPSPHLQARSDHISVHSSLKSLSEGNEGLDGSECEQDVNRATAVSGSEHSGQEREGEAGPGSIDTSKINSRAVPGLGIVSGSELETGHESGMPIRGSGSDGSRLECCPMCLMLFPAGSSQLECDGHLAQCLSEMNVDVVW